MNSQCQARVRGKISFASISCGEEVVNVKDRLQKVRSAEGLVCLTFFFSSFSSFLLAASGDTLRLIEAA